MRKETGNTDGQLPVSQKEQEEEESRTKEEEESDRAGRGGVKWGNK